MELTEIIEVRSKFLMELTEIIEACSRFLMELTEIIEARSKCVVAHFIAPGNHHIPATTLFQMEKRSSWGKGIVRVYKRNKVRNYAL